MVRFHEVCIDFEFLHHRNNIEPISLGAVDQNGSEFYIEFEFDDEGITPWILENVMTRLRADELQFSHQAGGREFERWVDHARGDAYPRFWAYFGSLDWVCLCNLFGGMRALPKEWPKFMMDLQQRWAGHNFLRKLKPRKPAGAHNALVDALWANRFREKLDAHERSTA